MSVARLYYECHVTIAPLTPTQRPVAIGIGERYGFKLAEFLMQRGEDGVDRPAEDPNSFLSARSNEGESQEMFQFRMIDFVLALQDQNIEVRRYKIEDTVLDSKREGDLLGLMGEMLA